MTAAARHVHFAADDGLYVALLRSRGGLSSRRRRGFCRWFSRAQAFPVMRFGGSLSGRGAGLGVLPWRGSVTFFRSLRALLLFFLGSFLDSGELSQNLFSLFRSFAAPSQLHREHLFDDGIKFRSSFHAQRLQFLRHARQPDANRPPLVKVCANLR